MASTLKLDLTWTLVSFLLAALMLGPSQLLLSSVLAQSSIVSDDDWRHCDSDICDPIVSKCRLTQRCGCDFTQDAKCAKDCVDCLEEKFGKCCGCVGLCRNIASGLDASHVGEISTTDSQLFAILTETDDIKGRWLVKTLDKGVETTHPELGKVEYAFRRDHHNKMDIISPYDHLEKLNCTVAFITRRLSMTRCKKYCVSMGASSFRWFHDGCCECMGPYCIGYGIDQPSCAFDPNEL